MVLTVLPSCHWHDIRKESKFFNTRQQGGASLIVSGVVSYYGATDLIGVKGNHASVKYHKTQQYALLSFAADMLGETWTFQQDTDSIQRSKETKKWLEEKNIDV